MSQTRSASVGRRYGLERVCAAWRLQRSSIYARSVRANAPTRSCAKRGPKTALDDATMLGHIRAVLADSPFTGEGYRKVWARLRCGGVRTAKARVLRLMRMHGLLAPSRSRRIVTANSHDGSITTTTPNAMWGTDATSVLTGEGTATVFIAIDHCATDCVGIHAARHGTRYEALEPIRQGIREHFGAYERDSAANLKLRHDHGSQYMSDAFQDELRFLGIESSPAFVRQPEGNGCAERFIRTLKEQLLWVEHFASVEELRLALLAFKERYNKQWLVQRHCHRTPSAVRASYQEAIAA